MTTWDSSTKTYRLSEDEIASCKGIVNGTVEVNYRRLSSPSDALTSASEP